MKRLVLLIGIVVLGAVAWSQARPAEADGGMPVDWPPLLNCADVNGSGGVDIGDILQVVFHFGTNVVKDDDGFFVPGDGYMLLYDLNGGGSIDIGDILQAVFDFGLTCPLVETQAAQATLATEKYRDWNQAVADGFEQTTQYVSNMGIHAQRLSVMSTTFDPEQPVGLIYKVKPDGSPDELIGLWYVVANPDICEFYTDDPDAALLFGVDPATCPTDEPEGFDGPEDNQDVSSFQRAWHDHWGICAANVGTPQAWVQEMGAGAQSQCTSAGGDVYVDHYAWMVHLYNFIPNSNGRFLMWATQNLP